MFFNVTLIMGDNMTAKKSGKKVFVIKRRIYVYFALVFCAVVLSAVIMFSAEKSYEISFYYSPSDEAAVVLVGGKMQRNVIPGSGIARVRYDKEKTGGALLMSEGSSYSLYYVGQNDAELVSDNCTSSFVMAHSGKKIVYISSDAILSVYDISSQTIEKIDEGAASIAVSPNGKTVLYSKENGEKIQLFLYSKGKSSLLSDGYQPLAVSDDAKYIYVLSNDNSLYLINNEGAVVSKLCSNSDTDMFCFSSDMKQIVFCDGAYTYISTEGKNRIRLASDKAMPAFTAADATLCNSFGNGYAHPEKKLCGMIYSVASGVQDYSLYYIDKEFIRTDISSGVAEFVVTSNGAVYLKTNGEVYSYKNGESLLLAKNASAICSSKNGQYVYYISDSSLYAHYEEKSVLIANGLLKMSMSSDDTLYYIIADKKLYSVSKTQQSVLVDENVYSCKCVEDAVYYSKNYSSRTGTFDIYGSDNSGEFTFLADGLSKI